MRNKPEWQEYCMTDLDLFREFVYNLIAQGYEKGFGSYNFDRLIAKFNLFLLMEGGDFR